MEYLRNQQKIKQTDQQFEESLLRKKNLKSQQGGADQRQGGPYQIPVVIHVIHNGEPVGTGANISDAQILSQIEVLNNDFKRLNADAVNTPSEFISVAGSLDIEFILAKQTPEGLPTTGIVRVDGEQLSWPPFDEELNALSYWPSEDYLNIWVTNIGSNFLGYAQFPVSNLPGLGGFPDGLATTDGVVIDYTVFGVGSSEPQYDLGRTTTHEVGHFFGLRHIWGDESGCSGTDYVTDTPNQLGETYDCPTHPEFECTNNKMFQNYMDYTDDVCMNIFTVGQVDRMSLILEDTDVPRRSSLLTSHGLDDPICGTDPPVDIAITKIVQPGPVTCNGSPELVIAVKNLSCPIVTKLKIEYNVNNGPTLSTTVTGLSIYSDGNETLIEVGSLDLVEEAENNISLEIALANGEVDDNPSNSETLIAIVHNTASDIIPLRKTFDDNLITSWTVANPQAGILWNLEEIDNQYSARFPTSTGSIGEESWLVSPVLDLNGLTEASLFFNLSYAWNGQNDDRLRILASTDCGDSYFDLVPGFDFQGSALSSNGDQKYVSISTLTDSSFVRIAFVGTNALGSNIYVDNIEFFVSDDQFPIDTENKLYAIYWDNAGGVNITFNLPELQQVGLSVADMMGREIVRGLFPDILNQTIPVPIGGISSGLYIIRIQIGKKYYATKVYLSP